MSKLLINWLLLENSNKLVKQAPITSKIELVPDWNADRLFIDWKTSYKNENIKEQASQITRLEDVDSATCRVFFRKVAKSLDKKNFIIVQHELRIKQLEARVVQLELRKQRKVRTSPNFKFAEIQAIRRAQIEAGDCQIEEEDAELSGDSDSIIDCIIVEE